MESTLVKAVEVVLSYGVLLALFWAFYDGTRFTNEQYKATGRMGRTGWLIALGFAIVFAFGRGDDEDAGAVDHQTMKSNGTMEVAGGAPRLDSEVTPLRPPHRVRLQRLPRSLHPASRLHP